MTKDSNRGKRIDQVGFYYDLQPKINVSSCNLCGNTYFVELGQRDRYGFKAKSYCCATCGLVFINPRMTAEAYDSFYKDYYRPLVSAYHGRTIDALSIQEEQHFYAVERAEFVENFLAEKSNGNLLDVGGSTGVVAEYFAQVYGFKGVVLDPSKIELEEAAKKGLEIKKGFIEEVEFGESKFNFVLLCQTVDHLLDITLTLEKIRSCLAQNGLFLVDIVDFRAAYLRNHNVEEAIKIDHPYYLTQTTIEAYLALSGFRILRKGFASDQLHINYLCTSTKRKPLLEHDSRKTEKLLEEIRWVQNTPAGRSA